MPTLFVSAFEPYDRWPENASWLTLIELTRELPANVKIVTRRYPVDFDAARQRLSDDLAADFDFALHLGQAPGSSRIHLEAIGINIADGFGPGAATYQPLVAGGPAAYQSTLPLADWSAKICAAGIPCAVSHHAGTYLCNALLYFTHHFALERRLKTQATFIHLPLAPEQVIGQRQEWPSLPSTTCARAVRLILAELCGQNSIV